MTAVTLITSSVALGNYHFKPNNGKVSFKTKGWPSLITIKGESKGVQGELKEMDGKVSGALSFDLQTLKTGISLRDDHMKNKYLEVTKYPKATLTLKNLMLPEKKSGDVPFKGLLKIHGVEKEVKGKVTLESGSDGKEVKMKGEIPIKLADFKIEIPSYKGITVAETVKVFIESKVLKN